MEARMTNSPHKVRIKLGDAEFEAEGTEESVKQQYADFLAALAARPSPTSQQQHAPKPADGKPLPAGSLDAALMDRVFNLDGDLVSLQFLPKTETATADALMLLLYAYSTLKNQDMVLGTQLTRAARQSGLGIERVDRSFGKYETESLLLKGGAKKGTKYGLNNQGKVKAQEILNKLASEL